MLPQDLRVRLGNVSECVLEVRRDINTLKFIIHVFIGELVCFELKTFKSEEKLKRSYKETFIP